MDRDEEVLTMERDAHMAKDYKYNQEMDALPECPPDALKGVQRVAFRFVHSQKFLSGDKESSFLPIAKLEPERPLNSDAQRCNSHGLSLFTTRQAAEKELARLKSYRKNIEEKLGDGIAKGEVNLQHGKCSKPNKKGHFTLFEFEGSNVSTTFNID